MSTNNSLHIPVDPAVGPRVRLHECVPVLQQIKLLGCPQDSTARLRVGLPAGSQELLAGHSQRAHDCLSHLRGQLGPATLQSRHIRPRRNPQPRHD